MYDLVENILNHEYVTNYGGDQQYIYAICGCLVVIFSVTFIDLIYRVFSNFWKDKKNK